MAAAAHGHVGDAVAVMSDVGDEAAVGSEGGIDLGGDDRLDLSGECVVGGEAVDDDRTRRVGVADDEALALGVVQGGAGEQFDGLGRDDDLETVDGADLVGESGFQVFVEAEVVAEVLAGARDDGHAKPEGVGVGFLGAESADHVEGGGGDLDDRSGRGLGRGRVEG